MARSMWGEFMVFGEPSKDELRLLEALIKKSQGVEIDQDWAAKLKVANMDDGGMGSVQLFPDGDEMEKGRLFGKRASECQFTDTDGIEVIASLNLDKNGKLYELDVWKIDQYPQKPRHIDLCNVMKIKCTRLLNADGRDVESSPWLTLGRIYHVMAIFVEPDGKRSFVIINRHPEGEWPQMGYQHAECFEIVSTVVPTNWRIKVYDSSAIDMAPGAWQDSGFLEAFYDHDPDTYPIFERERDIIMSEDP